MTLFFFPFGLLIRPGLAETLLLGGNFNKAEPYLRKALATALSHDRKLLLLQGTRLDAHLLASRGDWPSAQALFTQTLEHASSLHLSLEVARTKAVWGQALVRFAPLPHNGYTLLAEARQAFASHGALAELYAIAGTVRA